MLSFSCDDVSFSWENEQTIIDWLATIAREENNSINYLSFVYCSDARLLEINQQYLNHDYYTDIITFDLSDTDEIEGEIYISLDRIKENAREFAVSFEEELARVMAHGLLHLIGYDDHSPEDIKQMRAKEAHYLSLLPEVPRGTFQR